MIDYRTIVDNTHKLELLRRIYARGRTRDVEMHRGQVPILDYIITNDGCTQAEAAAFLGVTPASVALSAKRMAAAGLIERSADEEDMRRNHLSATEKGKRAFEDFMAVFHEIDERMFEGFSDEELNLFNEMLMRMIENIAGGNAGQSTCGLVRRLKELEEEKEC